MSSNDGGERGGRENGNSIALENGTSTGTSTASDPVGQEGLEDGDAVVEDEQSGERRKRRLAMNRITARERRRRKLQQIDDLKRGVQSLTIDNDNIREENRIMKEQIACIKSALQIPNAPQAGHGDNLLPASTASIMENRQMMFQDTMSHTSRQGISTNQPGLQGQISSQHCSSILPPPVQQPLNGMLNLQDLSELSNLQEAIRSSITLNVAHQQMQQPRAEFSQPQERMSQAPSTLLAPFMQNLDSTQSQNSASSSLLQTMLTNIYAQQANQGSQQQQLQQQQRHHHQQQHQQTSHKKYDDSK